MIFCDVMNKNIINVCNYINNCTSKTCSKQNFDDNVIFIDELIKKVSEKNKSLICNYDAKFIKMCHNLLLY